MLKQLKLKNVGPAPSMELKFGDRMNLITGDNGLGKSFLLDIAWWAMTRKWPAEINPRLTSGKKALPPLDRDGEVEFTFTGRAKAESYVSSFNRREDAWTGPPGRPTNPGLVLYATAEGGFAVWDPARNYWKTHQGVDVQERRPAYVFSPQEVWDGLLGDGGVPLANGLIRDWASWQRENGSVFGHLQELLKTLSPGDLQGLCAGELTRISLDDARDMPTLRMPYGQEVAVVHASAGMRRIIAFAYVLVWAWEEHIKASHLLAESAAGQVVFLIDEIESHLHPRWQFSIIGSMLKVMQTMAPSAQVQLVITTHSPLVLASIEPYFDAARDAWFDLDGPQSQNVGQVVLTEREFVPQGDVSNWLTSDAFDLPSARSPQIEALLREAAELVEQQAPQSEALVAMRQRLLAYLNPRDGFLFRWRAMAEAKGLPA